MHGTPLPTAPQHPSSTLPHSSPTPPHRRSPPLAWPLALGSSPTPTRTRPWSPPRNSHRDNPLAPPEPWRGCRGTCPPSEGSAGGPVRAGRGGWEGCLPYSHVHICTVTHPYPHPHNHTPTLASNLLKLRVRRKDPRPTPPTLPAAASRPVSAPSSAVPRPGTPPPMPRAKLLLRRSDTLPAPPSTAPTAPRAPSPECAGARPADCGPSGPAGAPRGDSPAPVPAPVAAGRPPLGVAVGVVRPSGVAAGRDCDCPPLLRSPNSASARLGAPASPTAPSPSPFDAASLPSLLPSPASFSCVRRSLSRVRFSCRSSARPGAGCCGKARGLVGSVPPIPSASRACSAGAAGDEELEKDISDTRE